MLSILIELNVGPTRLGDNTFNYSMINPIIFFNQWLSIYILQKWTKKTIKYIFKLTLIKSAVIWYTDITTLGATANSAHSKADSPHKLYTELLIMQPARLQHFILIDITK